MSCNASNATVSALNATVAALLAQLGSTDTTTSGGEVLNGTQPAPPVASPSAFAHSELCAPLRAQRGPHGRHNVPWRIGASFLVFGCSVLGVAASLLGHHSPRFALSDYAICFARTFGTGILIAAALLHQLSVASLSLTSNCLAWEFNTDYQSYAFLYCMLSFLGMQGLSIALTRHGGCSALAAAAPAPPQQQQQLLQPAEAPPAGAADGCEAAVKLAGDGGPAAEAGKPYGPAAAAGAASAAAAAAEAVDPPCDPAAAPVAAPAPSSAAPGPPPLAPPRPTSVSTALLAGLAFDCHGVLIGLITGCAGDHVFSSLVAALTCHHCFQGVALGSLLAEARLGEGGGGGGGGVAGAGAAAAAAARRRRRRRAAADAAVAAAFCLATPLGMAVALASIHATGLNNASFIMAQGTLDGVTSGVLLHVGATQLIKDFPRDVAAWAPGRRPAHCCPRAARLGLYAALSLGAAVTAHIKKYVKAI